MRKLFTLIVFSVAVVAALAQTAEFRYKGQPVADGSTIVIYAEEDDWGDLACETNPSANPSNGLVLVNVTDRDLKASATLTITSNTMAPQRIQWCMGGECVIVTENSLTKNFTVPAGGLTLTQFDAIPTQYGELCATIKAMVGLVPVSVDVRFVYADPTAPLTYPRRSVVEEFTGTWCGNCPRGIVGMRNLERDFGDRFIGIAVHSGTNEPMENTGYKNAELIPSGVPNCRIDRTIETHPYEGTNGGTHYGLGDDFAQALTVPAVADVAISAQWNESAQRTISCSVLSTFGFDSTSAPYAVAIVITEDGLHGEGRDWSQVNYYATATTRSFVDADMDEFYAAEYYVQGLKYDHVAVATLGIKNGEAGSIKAPIVKGQSQTYEARVAMVGNKIVQDKNNLSAIAMLIDTNTGKIVNAAKCSVRPSATDGISESMAEAGGHDGAASAIYDLGGRQVNQKALHPGLYVSRGRKVLIK